MASVVACLRPSSYRPPRRPVLVSIATFRGIGIHYHALLEESGTGGRSFAAKFTTRMDAETWILRMARQHFPVRTHRLLHSSREGPWFYREGD